jgi:tetratricopeptide (TPR) repeat protein
MNIAKKQIGLFGTENGKSVKTTDEHPLYKAAQDAEDNEQFSDMLHHASDLLECYPARPAALLLLGQAWNHLGMHQKAENIFHEAIQLYTDHYKIDDAHARADILQAEFEKSKYRDESIEHEIIWAELFISLKSLEAASSAWCYIGDMRNDNGDLDAAAEAYQQALTIMPDCIPALFELGHICRRQYRPADAINYFQKLTACDPEFTQAWKALAETYINLSRWHDAIKALRQCISIKAEDQAIWLRLGHAFYGLAEEENAPEKDGQSRFEFMRTILLTETVYCCRKSISETDSDSPELYISWKSLGYTYCQMKLYSLAKGAFRQTLELTDPNAVDLANLGYAQIKTGETKAGVKNCKNALNMDPECCGALDSLGVVELQNKNYAAAEDYFKQALEISPDLTDSILNLALTYCETAQWLKAFDQHKKLIKINPRKAKELRPHLNNFFKYPVLQ